MPASHDDVVAWFNFYPSQNLAIVAMALFIFFSLTVLARAIRTRACKTLQWPPATRNHNLPPDTTTHTLTRD